MSEKEGPASAERRDFLKKACAAAAGTAAILVPVGAGITVLTDPARRKAQVLENMFVTTLDALPADGSPRKFAIIASRTDAWNKFPNAPVGAIYLRKVATNKVEALNVICPHAGCFVDFKPDRKVFFCPCHNSSFALDGAIADKGSPSPRGMDSLEVEVRNEREIWVKFMNFKTGHSEKIPVA